MDSSMIETLILDGTLEVSGMTESGQITYSFTEKLKDTHPEIYEQMTKLTYKSIARFWELGFLEFDISHPDPIVTITDKAFDPEALEQLDEIEKLNLVLIIVTGKQIGRAHV